MKLLTTHFVHDDVPRLTFEHESEIIDIFYDGLELFIETLLYYHHVLEHDVLQNLKFLKCCGIEEIELAIPFIRLRVLRGNFNERLLYQYNVISDY